MSSQGTKHVSPMKRERHWAKGLWTLGVSIGSTVAGHSAGATPTHEVEPGAFGNAATVEMRTQFAIERADLQPSIYSRRAELLSQLKGHSPRGLVSGVAARLGPYTLVDDRRGLAVPAAAFGGAPLLSTGRARSRLLRRAGDDIFRGCRRAQVARRLKTLSSW
jgi:hypothetical protein